MDREREYEKGKERQGASERGTNVTKERKANKQSDGGGRRDKGRREKERRSEIIAEWHRAESMVRHRDTHSGGLCVILQFGVVHQEFKNRGGGMNHNSKQDFASSLL